MEVQWGTVLLRVVKGDITDFAGDAVVNAANDHLWMGSGVAGAIRRRGGDSVEREALAQGPIHVGEAVETGGGNLPARYVIHAAVMGQDLKTGEESIRKATKSSLEAAERLNVESMAFPALGTGVGGFPLGESARLMLGVLKGHFSGGASCIHEVVFVLYDDRALEVYNEELERFGAWRGA